MFGLFALLTPIIFDNIARGVKRMKAPYYVLIVVYNAQNYLSNLYLMLFKILPNGTINSHIIHCVIFL